MSVRARTATALLLTVSMVIAACANGDALDSNSSDSATSTSARVAAAGTSTVAPRTNADSGTVGTSTTISPTRATDPAASVAPIPASDLGGVGDPYYPGLGNRGYDVRHYDIDVSASPPSKSIDVAVVISATATAPLREFHLDLSGMKVRDVTLDGTSATFRRESEELIVTPPVVIPTGQQFTVGVRYSGTPVPIPDAGLTDTGWSTVAGASYVASEPNGAHNWLASNDHPSDKAQFSFTIDVPAGTTAAANGELIRQRTANGRSVFQWEADKPMASYLATVVIGAFTIVDVGIAESSGAPRPVTVRHVFPTTLATRLTAQFADTATQITVLSELFGPFPFDEYGAVVIDARLGFALETQTLSIFDRQIALSASSERFQVHELAHQWFGNSVSVSSWRDIWLNEGFSSYAEHLYREQTEPGFDIDASIAAWAAEPLGPISDPGATAMFEPNVYRRGAIALHALRRRIGDEQFFTVVRTWADRYGGGVADTQQFIALVNEVTGDDLRGFIRSWLDDESMPELPR